MTMIELVTAMAIFGVLAVTSVWGLRAYASAQATKGTANGVIAALRNAAERAQAEGRTYCVSFDTTTSWTVWRYSCDPGWTSGTMAATKVLDAQKVQGGETTLGSVVFSTPTISGLSNSCPAGAGKCAYFYPRGISSTGQLNVLRGGSVKYTPKVEGLTSRVYMG
jgi:type II secretory pathway pseudopilin PulG